MFIKNTRQLTKDVFSTKSEDYDEHYHDSHSRYSKEKQERLRLTLEILSRDLNSSSVADIGCGTAILVDGLKANGSNFSYAGVDSAPGMLEVARAKVARCYPSLGAKFYDDVSKIQLAEFDYVISLGVLGYQLNQIEFLGQLSRLLNKKNSGIIIITCGNGESYLRRFIDFLKSIKYRNKLFYKLTKPKVISDWVAKENMEVTKKCFLLPLLPFLPVAYMGDSMLIKFFYMTQFLGFQKSND
jgi:SAM-dependent methyltransferase